MNYDEVLHHPYTRSAAGQSVLRSIAWHSNNQRRAYPSVETIAFETQLCRRAVQQALRRLEISGFIISESVGGGRNKATRYYLVPPAQRFWACIRWLEKGAPAAPFTAKKQRTTCAPESTETAHLVPKTPLNSAPHAPERLLEPNTRSKALREASSRQPDFALSEPTPRAKAPSKQKSRVNGKSTLPSGTHHSKNGSEVDARHSPTRDLIKQLHREKFSRVCTWDGSEAKQLSATLKANPTWTAADLARLIRARFASDGVAPDRPRKWLPNLSSYDAGPLDKFGRPKQVKPTKFPTFAEIDAKKGCLQ